MPINPSGLTALEWALTPPPPKTAAEIAAEQQTALQKMMQAQKNGLGASASFLTGDGFTELSGSETSRSGLQGDTIAISLTDGPAPNLNADYVLYLRVERVP